MTTTKITTQMNLTIHLEPGEWIRGDRSIVRIESNVWIKDANDPHWRARVGLFTLYGTPRKKNGEWGSLPTYITGVYWDELPASIRDDIEAAWADRAITDRTLTELTEKG